VCYERILTRKLLEPYDVVIIILSQKEGYHAAHADYLRKGIYEQANALDKVCYIAMKLLHFISLFRYFLFVF